MMCAKRRILVADDDAGMRRACRAMFESDGYEVVAAKDGADALAKFDAGRFDLVVLDVMMPKMNGLDACAEIRRRDALTPVLFFTAMPSEASAVKALGHGADDYVEKSRPPEELRARVRAALRRADAYGDAARRGGEVAEDLRIGGVRADFATLTVEQNGRSTPLTKSEALVLRLLAGSPGRFFSRILCRRFFHSVLCCRFGFLLLIRSRQFFFRSSFRFCCSRFRSSLFLRQKIFL